MMNQNLIQKLMIGTILFLVLSCTSEPEPEGIVPFSINEEETLFVPEEDVPFSLHDETAVSTDSGAQIGLAFQYPPDVAELDPATHVQLDIYPLPTVVLLPDPSQSSAAWAPFGARLISERIAWLTVNIGADQTPSLAPVWAYLSDQAEADPQRTAVVGYGTSASGAIQFAASETAVVGLALISPDMHSYPEAMATALLAYGERPLLLALQIGELETWPQQVRDSLPAQAAFIELSDDGLASLSDEAENSRLQLLDWLFVQFHIDDA